MNNLIKVTTDYSLLHSMIKINDLISYCKSNEINVCGICDNNLFGAIEFYNECIKNNIKPLIGLSITISSEDIYLYAKNYIGFQKLIKIHTIMQKQELNFNILKKYNEDLICLSTDELYPELSLIYKDIYIYYEDESKMKDNDKKYLYINDIKCLNKDDLLYLNYLKAIEENKLLSEIEFNDYKNNYLKEINNKTILEEQLEFISKIDINLPKQNKYIPKYNEEVDSYELLYRLSNKGLNKRLNGDITNNYQMRLDYELSVIKNMGFVDYFLIVYDYVLYAKKNNILVGVGRGSAAGSLVSYVLGITDIDPIKYNLLFERFLNPERITMPDIDIDFENTKRDQVITYVKDKYGFDKVAGIMTFGTLKSRLVLRSVLKAMNIDPKVIDKFISNIDSKLNLKENLKSNNIKDILNKNDELRKAYKISMKLEDLKKNISSHAAGVVICSENLDEIIPVCYNNGDLFTGVTMNYLEDLGILKMDFLAIKNLTKISAILELIESKNDRKLNLNNIDLNDSKVLKLFHDGDTVGIFQFESEGMKNFLKKLKPSSFLELTSAIALYRPGPMENIDTFINRKNGKEKIDYIHPDLEDILKETYGIIIYQEQIMQILVKIGSYSFSEADNIRRAMSKKKKEIIENERELFVKRAIKNGYKTELAVKIYELILKFANYGFNKSHSVSYALIGYQMAYLKTYFKEYFFTNLFNNVIGSEGKIKEYIIDAKRSGFEILKPDINRSIETCYIENNKILLPLGIIKNVGSITITSILEEREKKPFNDFIDFVKRCYNKNINTKVITSLINAQVFSCFKINQKTLIDNLDIVINYAQLVADLDEEFVIIPEIIIKDDYTDEEKRNLEFESYGFYITNHPSSKYTDNNIVKIKTIKNYYNKWVNTIVLIENIKKIKTKNNDDMAFIEASDETGTVSYILFKNKIDLLNNLEINKIYKIIGNVEKRLDKYQISVTNIEVV